MPTLIEPPVEMTLADTDVPAVPPPPPVEWARMPLEWSPVVEMSPLQVTETLSAVEPVPPFPPIEVLIVSAVSVDPLMAMPPWPPPPPTDWALMASE